MTTKTQRIKTAHLKLTENRAILQRQLGRLRDSQIIPKTVDLRTVQPTAHYLRLISQHNDIATGRAKLAVIKTERALASLQEREEEIVQRGKRSFFKSRMRTDTKGRVLEEHNVRILKDGTISRTYNKTARDGTKVRVTQKELPVKYENLEQWVNDMLDRGFKLGEGESIYFTFFGNYSRTIYNSLEDALSRLVNYEAFQKARAGEMSVDHIQDMIKGIGLQKTTKLTHDYNRNRIADPKMDFSAKGKRKQKREEKANALVEKRKREAEAKAHKEAVDDIFKKRKERKANEQQENKPQEKQKD